MTRESGRPFGETIQDLLKDYADRLEKLSSRVGENNADLRAEIKKKMDALEGLLSEASRRTRDLGEAGDAAIEDLKAGLEKAWQDLKTSFESARTRF